jgi:hypothetical protein
MERDIETIESNGSNPKEVSEEIDPWLLHLFRKLKESVHDTTGCQGDEEIQSEDRSQKTKETKEASIPIQFSLCGIHESRFTKFESGTEDHGTGRDLNSVERGKDMFVFQTILVVEI